LRREFEGLSDIVGLETRIFGDQLILVGLHGQRFDEATYRDPMPRIHG
jgi:hypothetical protein